MIVNGKYEVGLETGVNLGHIVNHYNGCVQFECNISYHLYNMKNDFEWRPFVSLGQRYSNFIIAQLLCV